jgi:hypothetical protein
MAWANLRHVVWESAIEDIPLQRDQPTREVAASARSIYTPDLLLGGVLADHTDRLFQDAQQLRQTTTAEPSATASATPETRLKMKNRQRRRRNEPALIHYHHSLDAALAGAPCDPRSPLTTHQRP